MSDPVDLQPGEAEVLQEEPTAGTVDVPVCVRRVETPVRAQLLPRKAATVRTYTLTTTPRKVLEADHFRASALLTSVAGGFYYAFSRANTEQDETRGRHPVSVPLPITATVEIWAWTSELEGATTLAVLAEKFATGD